MAPMNFPANPVNGDISIQNTLLGNVSYSYHANYLSWLTNKIYIPPLPTLTHINNNSSSTDATSYDFGNFNAPTAGLMIAGVAARTNSVNGQITGVNIGGAAATIVIKDFDAVEDFSGEDRNVAAFAVREVSAGNQNVTFTIDETCATAFGSVWLLTNYQSSTPHDMQAIHGNWAFSNPLGGLIEFDIPAGGVGIMMFMSGTAPTGSHSWDQGTSRANLSVQGNGMMSADYDNTLGAALEPFSELYNKDTTTGSYSSLGISFR